MGKEVTEDEKIHIERLNNIVKSICSPFLKEKDTSQHAENYKKHIEEKIKELSNLGHLNKENFNKIFDNILDEPLPGVPRNKFMKDNQFDLDKFVNNFENWYKNSPTQFTVDKKFSDLYMILNNLRNILEKIKEKETAKKLEII